MSDPKQERQVGEEQLAEDLTLQDEQADAVRGGESISLSFGSVEHDYHPQK
jgi:hypothetical protein